MDDYIAALRADRPLSDYADYWAEDMHVFEPALELHSRAEMMGFIAPWLKTTKFEAVSLTTLDIVVHDRGAVAYHFAAVDETLSARDGKSAPVRARNNLLTRWVKGADGSWRIDLLMAVPRPKDPLAPREK